MKNSFKQFINEHKFIRLYHGSLHITTKLLPKFMQNLNNQSGVGTYFGNLEVASAFGNNIVYIDVDPLNFINGNTIAMNALTTKEAINILKYIYKHDSNFWYFISDYIQITNPKEINDKVFYNLWNIIKKEEIRNFQTEIAQSTNIKLFVDAWNKYTKIQGLFEKHSNYYIVIDTNIKLNKIEKRTKKNIQ